MIEVTLTLFKGIFVAFGLSIGTDLYTGKEFGTALIFRLQAFGLSAYVYLDSVDGFQKRAFAAANQKFDSFNKGYLLGKAEQAAPGTMMGRA